MKKTCLTCGKEFETTITGKKYCSDRCRLIAKNKRTRCGCRCVICGYGAEILTRHLKIVHQLTPDEYCRIYKLNKSAVISSRISKKLSDAQKNSDLCVANWFSSENNPAKGHSGRYSPYSMNFVGYDEMTDDERKKIITELRKRQQTSVRQNPQNQPTRIEFYTSRGMTQESAEKALSERQRTFTLKKCIKRYGYDKGVLVWKERQKGWQETLNAKPPKEIERINRAKNFCGKGYSKISQTLFLGIV
jgi:hypothetical protein